MILDTRGVRQILRINI